MRRLAIVALATIACGALTAHAQTLTLAYSKGAIYHYTLHTTSDFSIVAGAVTSPVKSDMKANETVTVESVDSSGVASVSVTVTSVSLTSTVNIGSGLTTSTTAIPTLPPVSLKMAPDGRIVSVNGVPIPGNHLSGIGVGGTIASAVLPDTSVKPGDTWSKTYDEPSPAFGGSIHVTARSTYLRDESFHGVQAAVVETASTTTISLDSKAATATSTVGLKVTEASDATSWIDPTSHRLLKTLMTSSDEMIMSAGGPAAGAIPGLAGPFTLKGKQTLDLEPA
jgi:hypothetical protein